MNFALLNFCVLIKIIEVLLFDKDVLAVFIGLKTLL